MIIQFRKIGGKNNLWDRIFGCEKTFYHKLYILSLVNFSILFQYTIYLMIFKINFLGQRR